jgi:plasmid stabilization system protein ParE
VNVIFVPAARDELLDAIAYYEDAREGLGHRFKEEVDRCIRWISDHHDLYRLRPTGYRRINLRVFPYHIPFITRGSALWILAVAHSARKPEYWIARKDKMG